MDPLKDAEKAHDLAVLYHERGDLISMSRWMRTYEELLRDARTLDEAPPVDPVRLVSRFVSLYVMDPVFNLGALPSHKRMKLTNGEAA